MVLAIVGLFLGGGLAGDLLARWLAPGSWVAEVAGLFALPVAFALSLQFWYGFALLALVPRVIAMLAGRRPAIAAGQRPSLPGAFVFLPASTTTGVLAGLITGIFGSTAFLAALLIWTAAGVAHGWLGWRLARRGYLVPPESV
jgi:hypothetical protein